MTPAPAPLDTPPEFRRRARYVVALVTTTAVVLTVLWITRQAVLLVFLGVAVGVLFYHASQWLSEKTNAPRGLMLGLVVVALLALLGAAVYFGGPRVAGEVRVLVEQAPEVIEQARTRLGLPEGALQLPDAAGRLGTRLLGVFSTLAGGLAGVLVVLLVAIYTAASPGQYTRGVVRLADRHHQPFVRRVLKRMGEALLGWLKGVGISVAALGTIAVIGLMTIGLPGALALAAFAGVLTVIPNFGPFIGWTPAVAVAFSQGTTTGLWTLGLAVVAQQIEGSFITPKIQGDMVSVAPAVVVAGQIVLAAFAGFLGLFLVVPILGVGKVLLEELYIGPFVEGEAADPMNPPPLSERPPETVGGAALEAPA
ncbi:AI-2E family transporter [Rubrivirga sp. S365]|uniref:AI-2E family transporter n=1 Tax=Rubrivirga litoralis TaxID=3075598 RepID=A0ABU3BLZ4_9BACT|nr:MULTISPECIES: AI-2E family transporter [unclassified Rubrivirga]MDT0630319.1 AI-2E family transporter [Rubrivirga sp. F394]MDT7855831.1 AI-2E family transporter [Rubrivirga sp. S365]